MNSLLWLAFLFTGVASLQLSLVNGDLGLMTFVPLAVLVVCGQGAAYILNRRHHSREPLILPLIIFLSGLGLGLTARLAPNFLHRQLTWLILATGLLLLVNLVPPNLNWLRHYKYAWLLGGLCLLATTLIWGVNPSGYGARLWLQVGPFYFQPSEPLKLFLVVFLAAYMADRHRQLAEARAYIGPVAVPHPSYWGPMLVMWGLSIILLIWQRDLGAALLFFGTFLGLVYAATGQARYVGAGCLLLMGVSFLGYAAFDVVRLRFEAFLNPWADPAGRSFQIVQSLLAFASGGFGGEGLGQGLPTAIPVVHTDFVFAAIGEEYGLAGALGVLFCFMLLVSRAIRIGMQAPNRFEQLLATGIGIMIGLQTLVITAGTLKLMPLTGVTLPFVSYGGSSLLTSFTMVGLLMFISNKRRPDQPPRSANSPFAPYQLRLTSGLLMAFLVVAGGLILWQIILAPLLVERTDNPRPIVAAQQVQRGPILASGGDILAETELDEQELARRRYHYSNLAPVTGHYSLRYGASGAEAAFNNRLRGTEDLLPSQDYLNELIHRPQLGQAITLTVELPAQLAADAALNSAEGAVVVIEIATGSVVVMASQPTYDPNQLNQQWEALRQDDRAPLLNRASQGLFPVGDLTRLIGLIGLTEAGAKIPPDPMTIPLNELLAPLGQTGYAGTVHQLGLTQRLRHFDSQPARLPDFTERSTVRDLAVTPLHLARVIAALENDGQLPQPRLSQLTIPTTASAFSPRTAQRVRAWLPQVQAQLIGLPGEATPQETGQSTYLSWFVGLAPTTASPSQMVNNQQPLIFDPSKITATPSPTPTVATDRPSAEYAIVVVVVTPRPATELATHIAETTLAAILTK